VASTFWKPIKQSFCDHVDDDVFLEVRIIFPAGFLADQPPRIEGHRCSKGMECNSFDRPVCCWEGMQPNVNSE